MEYLSLKPTANIPDARVDSAAATTEDAATEDATNATTTTPTPLSSSKKTSFAHYQNCLEITSRTALPTLQTAHDVLIQVAYSDVNAMDVQAWSPSPSKDGVAADVRLYKQQGHGESDIIGGIGHGGTGTVLAVGDAAPRQWVHKAVCFLTSSAAAAPSFATHVVVDCRCVALLPSVSLLREAATVPVAGCTAYQALARVGLARHVLRRVNTTTTTPTNTSSATSKDNNNKQSSQTTTLTQVGSTTPSSSDTTSTNTPKSLLVVGGSGAVGSWIITLVRAWHPHVTITATASTTAHQTWCHDSLGAHHVCAHTAHDILRTCGPKQGVDAVIWCGTEPPSSELWNVLCNDVLHSYGTFCFVTAPHSITKLDLECSWHKNITVTTVNVMHSIHTNYKYVRPTEELQILLQLLASQRIQAPLSPWLQGDVKQRRVHEKFKNVLQPQSVLDYLVHRNHHPDYHYCGNLVLCINAGVQVILVDVKTASLIPISRHDCIQQNIIPTATTTQSKGRNSSGGGSGNLGHDVVWKDAAKGSEREKLIKMLKDHPTLGILTALERKQIVQDIGLQEAENVKNLWGVSLKKRQRNKEGEEVIFIDPLTETLVELARDEMMARKVFTIQQKTDDSNQQDTIEENVTDPDERDELIQKIRKVLRLLGE